jgi:hypothetical protein
LGQFKLPVTITPISKATFFIDPANGNDAFPGTAAQPWKFVRNVLDSAKPTGSTVAAVANAGNNVVVTILGGTNNEQPNSVINTPALVVGSVTVLQAPFPKTFTLDMGTKQLTLNKGYKLQDINITFNFTGMGTATAVEITHPTAGLASVDVKCDGATTFAVTCVEVKGAGSHILEDVRVDVKDTNASNIGILNNDANIKLSIIGGRVRPTGNNNAITLIDSQGVLTVTGLTVDMANANHAQASTGIVLRAPGSSVTGSTISVSSPSSPSAKGIKVQHTTGKSTVEGNIFIGSGPNSIAVIGGNNLSSGVTGALLNNDFLGSFSTSGAVQP